MYRTRGSEQQSVGLSLIGDNHQRRRLNRNSRGFVPSCVTRSSHKALAPRSNNSWPPARWRSHRSRGAEVKAVQDRLKTLGDSLVKQQSTLLEKMLRGVVDDATYKAKNAEIAEQIRMARAQYQEAAGDEWDLETAVKLACLMVQHAAKVWFEMPLDHRQRLQGGLFPDGLVYDKVSGLGTAASRWPARETKEIAAANLELAPPRGVEPLLPG